MKMNGERDGRGIVHYRDYGAERKTEPPLSLIDQAVLRAL